MPERRTRQSARALVGGYRDGQVTLGEALESVEAWHASRPRAARESALVEALDELFLARRGLAPDPAIIDLVLAVLDRAASARVTDALLAVALRRPVLAAVAERAARGNVPDVILRPGCRVLLGTESGRAALEALLAGDIEPLAEWLDRIVLAPDAFSATTLDVPLGDLAGLVQLVDRLVRETETLPPGRARARVTDEWVSEVLVEGVEGVDDDALPYAELVRAVGERLLESDAPALLWHAAKQLSLVASDDTALAERVVERCLPLARLEDGRSPAAAAAPFLQVLEPERAATLLERLAPRMDDDGFAAVASGFLEPAFRRSWASWRAPAQRFACGPNAKLALAGLSALLAAGIEEGAALDWFRQAPAPPVRSACRAWLAHRAA